MKEKDVAILRKDFAAYTHLSAFGETLKRYGNKANKLNGNLLFAQNITWKTLQDLYLRFKLEYNFSIRINIVFLVPPSKVQQFCPPLHPKSVHGAELGKIADLFINTHEVRKEMARRNSKNTKEKKKDKEKEVIGACLMAAVTPRRSHTEDEQFEEEGNVESNRSIVRKKWKVLQSSGGIQGRDVQV